MIKIENTVLPSGEQWKAIIMGARNPMNSWARSDTEYKEPLITPGAYRDLKTPIIGPNDHGLMMKLRNAGIDHRKFMRMITVYVDITAPLYWWKEADTYSVGVVKNSCSTMHKIHAKEFTLEDFSHEHLSNEEFGVNGLRSTTSMDILGIIVDALNYYRKCFVEDGKSKDDWYNMIQLLPSSYNQKRTVMLNYEVLANIYKSRKNHKLDEWRELCSWIKSLPYSEIIIGEKEKNDEA